MRISDWSSDVCSSDLLNRRHQRQDRVLENQHQDGGHRAKPRQQQQRRLLHEHGDYQDRAAAEEDDLGDLDIALDRPARRIGPRSEEHTSELQSLMRISYAVFCLKKKQTHTTNTSYNINVTK